MKLRALRECDAKGMLEWMNDPQIRQWFRFKTDYTRKEDVLDFISKAKAMPIDGGSMHYAVTNEDDEYLGTISLKNINLSDRNAEYAISLRAKAQGKGIAMQATGLLLKKAFEEIGLERVYLNVLADNIRAVRFYEKTGFIYEGESKNSIFLKEVYRSLLWYRMLREEYDEKFFLEANTSSFKMALENCSRRL